MFGHFTTCMKGLKRFVKTIIKGQKLKEMINIQRNKVALDKYIKIHIVNFERTEKCILNIAR